jgi:hypothetical protein
MRFAAHPGLYDPDSDVPYLTGSRCSGCGRVSFPAMTIGCEVCGADEDRFRQLELETAGVIHSLATVHLHHGETDTPLTIGDVQLADGPLIRARLLGDPGQLAIGQPVSAVWVIARADDSGDEVVEPAFTAERR